MEVNYEYVNPYDERYNYLIIAKIKCNNNIEYKLTKTITYPNNIDIIKTCSYFFVLKKRGESK